MGGFVPIIGGLIGAGASVYASSRAESQQRRAMEDARRERDIQMRRMDAENKKLEAETSTRMSKLKAEQEKAKQSADAKKKLETDRLARLQARQSRGRRQRASLFEDDLENVSVGSGL